MKRTGPTNPYLKQLIEELKKNSREMKAPIWLAVAEKLERPRRKRVEVNLSRIQRYSQPNETIVVPGVVLGSGELKKQVRVAAWRFSESARKKIEEAGGKCLSNLELVKENTKGSNVKILT